VKQFLPMLQDLQKLHTNDFVHSDIRIENLVFDDHGTTAWLIDFDLIGKVGTLYPPNYNHHQLLQKANGK